MHLEPVLSRDLFVMSPVSHLMSPTLPGEQPPVGDAVVSSIVRGILDLDNRFRTAAS
jgi:hypothetical protein